MLSTTLLTKKLPEIETNKLQMWLIGWSRVLTSVENSEIREEKKTGNILTALFHRKAQEVDKVWGWKGRGGAWMSLGGVWMSRVPPVSPQRSALMDFVFPWKHTNGKFLTTPSFTTSSGERRQTTKRSIVLGASTSFVQLCQLPFVASVLRLSITRKLYKIQVDIGMVCSSYFILCI